jgi:hypothetical protein
MVKAFGLPYVSWLLGSRSLCHPGKHSGHPGPSAPGSAGDTRCEHRVSIEFRFLTRPAGKPSSRRGCKNKTGAPQLGQLGDIARMLTPCLLWFRCHPAATATSEMRHFVHLDSSQFGGPLVEDSSCFADSPRAADRSSSHRVECCCTEATTT